MVKNALTRHFDYDCNQMSPVQIDFERVVSFDDAGNEFISFKPVDYFLIQKSLGNSKMWTLNSLLKAGIDPKFPISTGLTTRLQGVSALSEFASVADAIISENENKSE